MAFTITKAGLPADALNTGKIMFKNAENTTPTTFSASGTYTDHISITFTTSITSNILCCFHPMPVYESGAVIAHSLFFMDGSNFGGAYCFARQTANNSGGANKHYEVYTNLAAGTHTVKVGIRNAGAGSFITPYGWNTVAPTRNRMWIAYYGT